MDQRITQSQRSINELTDPGTAFVDCIMSFSRQLEADNVSTELQDMFFRFAEGRNSLPEKVHQTVIDSFLAILVSIISFNQFSKTAVRALKILFEYLKNGN